MLRRIGAIWASAVLFQVVSGIAPEVLAQGAGPPPKPPVTVAQPIAKRITNWDEYWGRFEAVDAVEVRPRVSGFIEAVKFKDGQIVKAGDVLFTIDKRQFQIALDRAKAEVERIKSQVALAENEVERIKPLMKTAVATERDFDQRTANLLGARAQLQSAEASLKSAQLNLEWTEVRAPIAGRISDSKVDVGNLITGGNSGTTLLTTIVSLDPIHFVFEASEADYLRYKRLGLTGERPSSRDTANPVRLRLADEKGFTHEGQMDFVDNQLDPKSGTIRGRAVFSNKEQIFIPGMFARLQLFGGEADALLLPDSAIVSDQARKIVLVVGEGNVVKPVQVELGAFSDGLRVVKSGLKADDKVIIKGLANPMVRPGAEVTPEPGEIKPEAIN